MKSKRSELIGWIRKRINEIKTAGDQPFVFVFGRRDLIDLCCALEMELTRGLDKTKPEDLESDIAYLDNIAVLHSELQDKLNGK